MTQPKSHVKSDLGNNLLTLTFNGFVTSKEMSRIYTDVRFCVQDLSPGFSVITDFTGCRLMYLNALLVFRKIYNYILTNNSGEMVRVVHPKRIITKQILNFSLQRSGYKPIYAKDLEEAKKVVESSNKRDGLRFQLYEMPVTIVLQNARHDGSILNLSTSGCAISSQTVEVRTGEQIQVEFAFRSQKKIEKFDLQANVIRVDNDTFAAQFTQLSNLKKNLLWACLITESE